MDTRHGLVRGVTEPERRVWQAAGTGELVDLRVDTPELNDPATGATWDTSRTVRAKVLIELLVGARIPGSGLLRAVRLAGARITGQLDLATASLTCPLLLWDCSLEEPVNLNEVRAPVIRLRGCHLPGLAAQRLETHGDLELAQGFTATEEVCLLGAHIGGALDLRKAALSDPDGHALSADRLTVDQGMYCREEFTAAGEVSLHNAHIRGILDLNGATLTNPDGYALRRRFAPLELVWQDPGP